MKKYTAIAIAALSLLALSCAKEMPVEIKNDSKVVFTAQIQQQADETKTTLGPAGGSTRVVKWDAEDVIKVFNEATPDGVNFSIVNKESYIPSTQADFEGAISGSNPFYAVYPSAIAGTLSEGKISITLPSTQTYAAETFANGMNPSFAYSNDPEGGNLNFVNLCGVLKLKITSGTATPATKIIVTSLKETEMLSGKFNITNLDTAPALEYVDGGSRALTLDLGTVVSLSSTATEFYFVVPEGSFASGMVVSVYNEDAIVGSVMTTTAHAITKGKIKNISSINIYEAVINLSASETANCYIVPAAGKYKFLANVKGNGRDVDDSAADIAPASVAHLWSTQNSAEAPTSETAIVKGISAVGADGYVSFEATGNKGNVIVAGYSEAGATGDILWSWHLWATDVPSTHQYTNAKIMDRYIGALSNHYSAANVDDLGFMYQWGRKDPFTNICHRTNNPTNCTDYWGVRGIPAETSSSSSYQNSVEHPTWFFEDNVGTWTTTKNVNDPCPTGYHVATSSDITSSLSSSTWDSKKLGRFADSTDWYPCGMYSNGARLVRGASGAGNQAILFYVSDSDFYCSQTQLYNRARGYSFSVRCVRESN